MFLQDHSSFESFVHRLSVRLKQDLPGLDAQLALAPAYRAELLKLAEKRGQARQSAVMILLFPENGQISTVFIQRNLYDGVHSGQVAFPGGRFEETDPNLEYTALREMEEEIGIPMKSVHVIGTLTKLFIPPSNFDVLPVMGYIGFKPDFKPDASEVSGVFSVPLSHLANPANCSTKPITLADGRQFDVPCFVVGDYVIWGATLMIISELVEVLKDI